ncbi:MAG: hypothetical protein V1872_14745 [bacterium]
MSTRQKNSLNTILGEAVESFNYPEEMGESVHESVETLEELLGKVPEGGIHKKLIKWLLDELSKEYAREADVGHGSRYTLARLSKSESCEPVLEAFHFKNKIWIKIEV